ncbi:Putative phage regulator/ repressor protein [Paracholeplasma brassicae]|uniref:Putative phage regulator/ repressor protein n=1 Tax=Acholeplasma brassicae TaxID=61635 RepID=U4KM48_9MOLU|nr:helix-turn-helix transcriptional regulator [Paracholeplasma brassicae]CCV65157.1 Putative phage regulator/ repressor protein [Paracholeplasma brassicae]
MNINENIKRLRTERNLTQQEVADQLFVTRQCISRWEGGKTIPDIKSMEQLALVFNCSINDIFEEDTLKELTLTANRQTKNQRKHVFILSVSFVLLLFLMSLSFFILNKRLDASSDKNTYDTYAIIEAIDYINYSIVISTEYSLTTYTLNYQSTDLIYNNDLKPIKFDLLGVSDLIYIKYQQRLNNPIIKQTILVDKKTDKSLLGVAFVSNGKDYQTTNALLDDINNYEEGIKYYTSRYKEGSSSVSFNLGISDVTSKKTYKYSENNKIIGQHQDIELTIFYDKDKLTHEPKLILIYEDALVFEQIVTSQRFTGSLHYDRTSKYTSSTITFTFDVNIRETDAYEEILIYEYDKNNLLIKETTLLNATDMYNYEPTVETLYAIVKVNYYKGNVLPNYQHYSTTHKLYLGDLIDINEHQTYGLVIKTSFKFQ